MFNVCQTLIILHSAVQAVLLTRQHAVPNSSPMA